jgi:riboflavin transporter FmnP
MAKTKRKNITKELDSIYFLKLVVYLILGSLWFKVSNGETIQIGIPVGFMAGIVLATHDHIQLDRKIGYAVLLVAMLIGFWLPFGIYLNL